MSLAYPCGLFLWCKSKSGHSRNVSWSIFINSQLLYQDPSSYFKSHGKGSNLEGAEQCFYFGLRTSHTDASVICPSTPECDLNSWLLYFLPMSASHFSMRLYLRYDSIDPQIHLFCQLRCFVKHEPLASHNTIATNNWHMYQGVSLRSQREKQCGIQVKAGWKLEYSPYILSVRRFRKCKNKRHTDLGSKFNFGRLETLSRIHPYILCWSGSSDLWNIKQALQA